MFKIRYVSEMDRPFWFTQDRHLSEDEFKLKIRDKRGYVILYMVFYKNITMKGRIKYEN